MSSRFAHRAVIVAGSLALGAWTPFEVRAQDIWGGSLTLTSDYRVRGLSKTRTDAALQGGLHVRPVSGWFVGVWASNVRPDRTSESTIEIDAYTGYAWNIAGDWDAKLAFTHYWYPDDPASSSYDYDEVTASLAFRSQLIASIAWSPNAKHLTRYRGIWHTREGAVVSYELAGLQPVTTALSLTGGVGYSDLRHLFDTGYWYWNAGVTYAMGPVQLDVSRIDSDATAEQLFGPTVSDAGWSAAISWRF